MRPSQTALAQTFYPDFLRRYVTGKYIVYQCKRVDSFGPRKIRDAVLTFLEGKWADQADTFVLCITQSFDSTAQRDEIELQRGVLKKKGITFVIWDTKQLSLRLKELPDLVDDFFGRPWVEAFCGRDAARRLAEQLDKIVREGASNISVGTLIGIPGLPPHFLPRADDLGALKSALLADQPVPAATKGMNLRIGIQGMAGSGKSVLASSLARDPDIRRAFPDGVLWVTLGQEPVILTRQTQLCASLSPVSYLLADVEQGKAHLEGLLRDRACLLILDDVWQIEHLLAFDAIGPRCRMLLTTRDTSLITAVGGVKYELDVLSDAEALKLLADWVAQPLEKLPLEANEVARECGKLPLGLALSGALVRDGVPWADLFDALREADLEFFDHPHGSIIKSMKVSIDILPIDQAQLYMDLAVFPFDTALPEATIVMLWRHKYALSDRKARRILTTLSNKSLLYSTGVAPTRTVELHDLQHAYLRSIHPSLKAVHHDLLASYKANCPHGLHTGPNDGYFYKYLAHHLVASGRSDELFALLTISPQWMESKYIMSGDDTAYIADLELGMKAFEDPLTLGAIPGQSHLNSGGP